MYLKKAVIDQIEGDKAVIRLEDGQTLFWETNNLPRSLGEGSEVMLEIKEKDATTKNQQELAQHILNEIFNHAGDTR